MSIDRMICQMDDMMCCRIHLFTFGAISHVIKPNYIKKDYLFSFLVYDEAAFAM